MPRPEYYPQSCPPHSAQEKEDLTIYRYVKNDPPNVNDFKSNKSVNLTKDFGEKDCEACGLSVLIDKEDAVKGREKIPGFAKKKIAQGLIGLGDGEVLHTPSTISASHHTWWKNEADDISTRFNVVA
jgi:hypothetical protein